MAYQVEQAESKRVVVDTPNSRREVVQTDSVRYPDRNGVSGAALVAIVIGVIALAAVIILFAINRRDTVNANVAQQPPQTTIVQQPAQQPPNVIVQQPAPVAQPAPVIVNSQPASAAGGTSTSTGPDDSTIQTAVDKKFSDDPNLSSLGITATVQNGKVTLLGSVKTAQVKAQVERVVQNVKGVKSVDNQISVG